MELVNRIDFCEHSLTSAGKGIIDGSVHFSFLNTVILGRFLYICKEGKKQPISW